MPGMDQGGLAPLTVMRALTSWRLQPVLLVVLLALAVLYLYGVRQVGRRRPAGRWPRHRTAAFLAGLTIIEIATGGGVGVYADTLFWIHMIQHLLLIMVAPALLAASWPGVLLLHAARNPVHTRAKRVLRSAPVGWLTCPLLTLPAYAVTLVGTHLTGFMSAAMTSSPARSAEHALYLAVGFLLLVPVLGAEPVRWRLSAPAKLFLLVLTMPIDTFTGVVLLQTSRPLYPGVAGPGWGPGQVQDIQWSGAVMWIGGDGIMFALMLLVGVGWARSAQRSPSRRSWMERARLTTLGEHLAAAGQPTVASGAQPADRRAGGQQEDRSSTGTPVAEGDQDQQLAAYNAWLARLDRGSREAGR